MYTWGLGIEHEMRVRFQHKINILDMNQHYIQEINKKFRYIPNYLFIDSNLLYNYYRKYCSYIIDDYYKRHFLAHQELKLNIKKKHQKKKKNQTSIFQIYHEINMDTDPTTYIYYCAINELDYPIENSIYFNSHSEKWLELFYQYILIYSKKFFYSSKNFHIIKDNDVDLYLNVLNYEIIPEINLLVKKNVIEINKKLKKGEYEKKFKIVLKSLIKKYQLNLLQIQYNDVYILKNIEKNTFIFTLSKLESIIKKNIYIPNKQEIQSLLIKIINNYSQEKKIAYSRLQQTNNKKNNNYKNNQQNNNQQNNQQNDFTKIYEKNIDLIHFMITLYKLNIPETDYSSKVSALEFKTYDYQNNNYKKQLDDLISIESLFFTIVNVIPELQSFINVFGKIEYHQTGSLENTIILNQLTNKLSENDEMFQKINKDYAGSFHVWITIPYEQSTSPENFSYQHACLGNRLQLLEPIFSSYFTSPDIHSIGDALTHSRTSLRQFLNVYAGYGTSDVSYLNGIEKELVKNYYLSKEDVFRNKSINLYNWVPVIDSHNKKIIKNYNGLNTRAGTVQFYQKYFDTYEAQFSLKNNKQNNIHIDNYLLKLFQHTNISPENNQIPLGADIRTLDFNKIFYPELDENYEKIIILEKNKFVQYYFDKKNQKIISNPKFKEKQYKQLLKNGRVGIEFRIFDHQPTANLIQFLALCAQIVVYSMSHFQKIKTNDIFINKQLWHDEMVQSMIQGFEYKLSKAYISMIEKEFKIQLNNKNELTGVQFFETFYDKMNHKFMNSKKYKNIYTKLYVPRNDIVFENFNQKVWTYNFYLYLQNHPKLLNQLSSIIYSSSSEKQKKKDMLSLLRSAFSYNLNKIMTIME